MIRTGTAFMLLMGIATGCFSPSSIPTPPRSAHSGSEAAEAPPAIYGHGRTPSSEEIAEWDIDIMPDGEGLPDGRGSVESGRALYALQCARCHGSEGQGGPFDRLAGRIENDAFPFALDPRIPKTIGNYWPWPTTIFDYTRRAMPQDRPGSLTDDEVYSLTAYLLYLNGLLDEDAELDRRSLPSLIMPARDRFVPDDRRDGAEIR